LGQRVDVPEAFSSGETIPRSLNRLKPLTVDKAKTPGRHTDGDGL
jgi:hypothetical protein